MLFVFSTGIISRFYNGTTGASLTGGQAFTGCGFTVNRFTQGGYGINFGFQVNDRFVSLLLKRTFQAFLLNFTGQTLSFLRRQHPLMSSPSTLRIRPVLLIEHL
jgi:hypothetical protein